MGVFLLYPPNTGVDNVEVGVLVLSLSNWCLKSRPRYKRRGFTKLVSSYLKVPI